MSKKDPKKHGIFGVSNTIYNSQHKVGLDTKERTHLNVFDDTIWGHEWTAERRRIADELQKKQHEGALELTKYIARKKDEDKQAEQKINEGSKHQFDWPKEQAGGVKYHVSPDGVVRRCNAKSGPCPYGADDHVVIREDQLKFLSAMGYSGEERQNIIGHWVKDQQNTKKEETTKLQIEPGRTMRQLMQYDLMKELQGGKPELKVVEVDASIELETWGDKPARLSRKIGNTRETPWKDHAYWTFDAGKGEAAVLRTDRVKDADINEWVESYIRVNASTETEKHEELREELRYQIKEIIKQAESQAHRVDKTSAHYSPVPLEFDDGMIAEKVNFSTSSFTPSMLDNVPVEGGGKAFLAEGFEVFERELGEGAAGWKAIKGKNNTWELEVQGSRGDRHQKYTSDPEEAAAWFEEIITKRVTSADLTRQRLTNGLDASGFDLDKQPRVASRAAFISELIKKDTANEELARQRYSEDIQTMASEEGQGSLF